MADIDGGYAASQVNEFSATIIIKVLHASSHCKEGLRVVGFVEGEHVLLVQFDRFSFGYAFKLLGLNWGKPGKAGRSCSNVFHLEIKSALCFK